MKSTKPRAEAWIAGLTSVLAEITGSRPAIAKAAQDGSGELENIFWWRCLATPSLSIGVSDTHAALLREMRHTDVPTPAVAGADRAGLAEILDKTWGRGELMALGPADTDTQEFYTAAFSNGKNVRFIVSQASVTPRGNPNLDMLMDIELPLMLRFGSAQMALRDLTGLSAGSVVEFDRGVDEPVEVMVNGHVVARGEAVTVQGRYGVRISEIASRQERLMTTSAAAHRDSGHAAEHGPEQSGGETA